ncbi:MAG: ornithine cyclodeaminase family protein [Firmicutes bacterium]|jgi:alanine dehydrogenase|nr:ornithine cyclodeaminase family protein [Bacillota bacterium]
MTDDKRTAINPGIVLLDRREVESLLSLDEVIECVESAYAEHYRGNTILPPVVNLALHEQDGEIDVKTGYMKAHGLVGVKVASGFYRNEKQFGIPSGAAVILLEDAETGFPLAFMDGSHITTVRTGAAGAVGAKYLARPESETVCLVGAGEQARIQLLSLVRVLPRLKRAIVFNRNPGKAWSFAREMAARVGLDIVPVESAEAGVREADIVVTVTPSTSPLVMRGWLRPGTHVNAIGSDGPGKQELDPLILRDAKVVVDSWQQASAIGECQHGVKAGFLPPDGSGIWGEIGAIAAGAKPGRQSRDEITVFDCTGMAVQDVATAALVYRRALERGTCRRFAAATV